MPANAIMSEVMANGVPANTLTNENTDKKNKEFGEAMGVSYHNTTTTTPELPLINDHTASSEVGIAHFVQSQRLPHDYNSWPKRFLHMELRSRVLHVSGNKTVMKARLHRNDAEQPPKIMLTFHRVAVFPFMKLPPELRNMIYRDLLALRFNHESMYVPYLSIDVAHPQILRTCHEIYNEAYQLFRWINRMELTIFSHDTFAFRGGQRLILPPTNRQMARSPTFMSNPWLAIPAFVRDHENLDVHLAWNVHNMISPVTNIFLQYLCMHVNTFTVTVLPTHKNLQSLRIYFDINASRVRNGGQAASDREMALCEFKCLMAFRRVRGLREVEFHGFLYIDPVVLGVLRNIMTQP